MSITPEPIALGSGSSEVCFRVTLTKISMFELSAQKFELSAQKAELIAKVTC